MEQPQLFFDQLISNKKKQKDLKIAYKDALKGSTEYQEISEKIKALQERRKQVESAIGAEYTSELNKIEDLKIDIESDQTLLTDAALTKFMKGETVEVKDEWGNVYEPVWSVKFKKK